MFRRLLPIILVGLFSLSSRAEVVRIAPLRYGTGDEGRNWFGERIEPLLLRVDSPGYQPATISVDDAQPQKIVVRLLKDRAATAPTTSALKGG